MLGDLAPALIASGLSFLFLIRKPNAQGYTIGAGSALFLCWTFSEFIQHLYCPNQASAFLILIRWKHVESSGAPAAQFRCIAAGCTAPYADKKDKRVGGGSWTTIMSSLAAARPDACLQTGSRRIPRSKSRFWKPDRKSTRL